MTNALYQIAEGACIPAEIADDLGRWLDAASAADTFAETAAQALDHAREDLQAAIAREAAAGTRYSECNRTKDRLDKELGAFLRANGLCRRAEGIMTMDEAEDRAASRRTMGPAWIGDHAEAEAAAARAEARSLDDLGLTYPETAK